MTPQELKNSILQLAIQGKLVEQRQEEGTGATLYNDIQVEKDKLVKEGKIKKTKKSPLINEDVLPFDIPDTWTWCYPEDISVVVVGATPSTSNHDFWGNGSIPWLPSGCCQDCEVNTNEPTVKYISKEAYDSCSTKLMPTDTVMIALTGATAGKVGLLKFEACGNQSIVGIIPFKKDISKYLYYHLMARRSEILSDCVGSAQPHISKAYVTNMVFPLPPLAEQKRIVEKIEELFPLIDQYEVAYNKLERFNRQFPLDLQKSILQMAVQGELVPQYSSEENGEELYKKIQMEKQALIKAGKVKKDRRTDSMDLPQDNDYPYDIPKNWKWVYLGSILNKLTDGTHKTPKYSTNGIKFVSVKDMSNGVLSLDNTKYITVAEHEELFKRCDPVRGDMLLSKVGTTGVPAKVDTDEPFSLFVSVALLKYSHKYIDETFLYYLLKSPLVQIQAAENTRGVGNKNWVLDAIAKTKVVLPPFEEQKRIVAKLEELLPICERLKN